MGRSRHGATNAILASGRRAGSWLVWSLTFVLGLRLADGRSSPSCAVAVNHDTMPHAAQVCAREFSVTGDPLTGTRLADSLRQSDQLREAASIAFVLLATSAQADAWQILGNVARAEGRPADAKAFLELARSQHEAIGDREDTARDSYALSRVLSNEQDYAPALLALDECIKSSRVISNPDLEYSCHLAAENILAEVGRLDAAGRELELATAAARKNPDYGWREQAHLEYMRAKLEKEFERSGRRPGHHQLTIASFERFLVLNQRAQLPAFAVKAELNLVISLAEVGRFGDAEAHLLSAHVIDPTGTHETDELQTAAVLAFRRGDHSVAFGLNERIYDKLDDSERVDVAVMQARIALAADDLVLAERWARRGVDTVEKIRNKQTILELRPWVLSSRRAPYELRFLALIRGGRLEDALLAFDQWQGRTVLDALVPRADGGDLRRAARQIGQLGVWLPLASRAPVARLANDAAVLATLKVIDLLVFAVADGELWVITSRRGTLRAHTLGRLADLRERLDRFTTSPIDRELASELGLLLLPDGIAYSTSAALHVAVDGQLAALPVAALRIAEPLSDLSLISPSHVSRPLVALRPVVRELRLPELPCTPARSPTHAIVLADPAGDLPDARTEAAQLAQLGMSTTTSLGTQATSEALFAVLDDDALHLAVHGRIGDDGGALVLRDRDVSALEISARKLRASLVVLSACESARSTSDDVELAGALASGFLSAGSSHVVATLRVVSDEGAAEVTRSFYRAGGLSDPVRALAVAQTALDETASTDWPRFAIFGQDICLANP